jgi:hypothetical protein
MKITLSWLQERDACQGGKKWFSNQDETHSIKIVDSLIQEKRYGWSNWLICRLLTYKQTILYVVFVTELVLDAYEQAKPNDKRPRLAIEAAKQWVKNPTKENRNTAYTAAHDAMAAANDADADDDDDIDAVANAACVAANAAFIASCGVADDTAINTPYAANKATHTISHITSYASDAELKKLQLKILTFGRDLLHEGTEY